jgi:hypothetical protein
MNDCILIYFKLFYSFTYNYIIKYSALFGNYMNNINYVLAGITKYSKSNGRQLSRNLWLCNLLVEAVLFHA